MNRPRVSAITAFGLGSFRPAPGTWGSLPPILIAVVLLVLGAGPNLSNDACPFAWPSWSDLGGFRVENGVPVQSSAIAWNWFIYHGVMVAVMFFFGLACLRQGAAAEAVFGRKDPSNAVADEVAGQCIPLMFLPSWSLSTPDHAAVTLVIAFLAFRAMDILKPWPAYRLQKIPGGLGILIDDLVAGVYAAIFVQLFVRIAM